LNPIVLFSSKGGNTEKVANEIAAEISCPCINVTKDSNSSSVNLKDFDLVFLGTGNYVAKPNGAMLDFLKGTTFGEGKTFALFTTWFGRGTSDKEVYGKVKEALEAKGQKILESNYCCLGEGHSAMTRGFARLIGHAEAKGHPNQEDLTNARKWAKELLK
jgi:flavodoxin